MVDSKENYKFYLGVKGLRGDLCTSGPGHFASKKSFP